METQQYEADVWIVSLNDDRLDESTTLTLRDVPFLLNRYFYPAWWPRRLNTSHMGFRYDGRLMFTAPIVRRVTLPNLTEMFPSFTVPWVHQPHICVELGPTERFGRTLRSGPIWNSPNIYCDWVDLNRARTIREAAQATAERRRGAVQAVLGKPIVDLGDNSPWG